MRRRLLAAPSPGGLLLGALLFALSLTPSMVPRGPLVQGALGGALLAIGYLLWRAAAGALAWLDLAPPPSRLLARAALALAGLAALGGLWAGKGWQDSVRAAWGLPPLESFAPLLVAGTAAALFVVLLGLGRAVAGLALRLGAWADRLLPTRAARAVGLVAAGALVLLLVDGVLLRGVVRAIDGASRVADALTPPGTAAPEEPGRTGGPGSLVAWEDLGAAGRDFVSGGPDAARIAAFWGEPAPRPIRVYVGLTGAPTPEARARLAFDELLRQGGFERAALVIAMPTGTGWLDPGAMDSLDVLARGDVATVAVQYSYLPSPVSVFVDPSHGRAEARALFDLVYGHWKALPRDARPRLYLHGLSLGAHLSQDTVPLLDVLADPFDGAMWAGSPFLSTFWRMVVERREPGSPAWRPRFGNGSLIRASNQAGDFGAEAGGVPWGPMRLVFLQYGSDPIVFFDPSLAWRRPGWLEAGRAPDVSPLMRWIPLVTAAQVAVDMGFALGVRGFGHDYAPEDYIPAWAATLGIEGWTQADTARLARTLSGAGP